MDLYHCEIGFPRGARTPVGTFALAYTQHAFKAALTDKYTDVIDLPDRLVTRYARVIEIGMEGAKVSKIVYRIAYDDTFDLCLAVVPGVPMVVKTVWLQKADDHHKTLNRGKYCVPEPAMH